MYDVTYSFILGRSAVYVLGCHDVLGHTSIYGFGTCALYVIYQHAVSDESGCWLLYLFLFQYVIVSDGGLVRISCSALSRVIVSLNAVAIGELRVPGGELGRLRVRGE